MIKNPHNLKIIMIKISALSLKLQEIVGNNQK